MKWFDPPYNQKQRLVADDGEIIVIIEYTDDGWRLGTKLYVSAEAARAAAKNQAYFGGKK